MDFICKVAMTSRAALEREVRTYGYTKYITHTEQEFLMLMIKDSLGTVAYFHPLSLLVCAVGLPSPHSPALFYISCEFHYSGLLCCKPVSVAVEMACGYILCVKPFFPHSCIHNDTEHRMNYCTSVGNRGVRRRSHEQGHGSEDGLCCLIASVVLHLSPWTQWLDCSVCRLKALQSFGMKGKAKGHFACLSQGHFLAFAHFVNHF